MINTFSFTYPWWYLTFCLALGVGYAFLMYFKDNRFNEYSHWFTKLLASLRTLVVSLIALLLLSPFVKTIKEETKDPILIIATDHSSSIKDGETPENITLYQSKLNSLAKSLDSKFDLKYLNFGTEVQTEVSDSFNSKSTNISKLFQFIKDNYSDQNLGAVIMCTDGIYNEGSNPVYSENKFTAPLFTVALGDTTQKKDLFFQNVLHNKIVYLGDKFSVQADISAFNCLGSNSNLTLEIISDGQNRVITSENISINSQSFFTTKTFFVDALKPGVIRYRLRLSNLKDEYNQTNNTKDFFIEVLDARQKILLLANAPHPDLGAIKASITGNKNYEVEVINAKDLTGSISKYNLIIFHNLPSETYDVTSILFQMDKNRIPRIFIVGMQTSLPKFNKVQDIVKINGNSKNNEDIQADFNGSFTLFTTSDALKNKLKSFPPLITPFGEYISSGTGYVYLYQNIKKIKTNYPLLSFGDKSDIKTTVLCGEGFWKWRMFDHLQNQSFDLTSELLNKTVQLTSAKTDKRKFRANVSKNIYDENETVLFDAQLYNDNYEMINDPEVKLVIKNENNKDFSYIFSKTQNFYTLNADLFAPGSYTFTASTNFDGKALSTTGKFNVASIQLEQFDLTARHSFLRQLSSKYRGQSFYPGNMEKIEDILLKTEEIKPVLYQSTSTKSIIHLKWIFFLILFLLSLEWFLRRYFGNY